MEAVAINDQPSTNIPGNEDGPLVAVTFQKNPHQVQKYLEAEPKALGLTQITLGVLQFSMYLGIFSTEYDSVPSVVMLVVGSLFVIIAGSVAIAAQTLHLPTLKACLGMQVVASMASVINLLEIVGMLLRSNTCWEFTFNDTVSQGLCQKVSRGIEHYIAELILINSATLAICVTLAAYCCKVINCCTPTASTPVITINAPPAQQ
ncbi:hypothetical protein SKAU_G00371280 [Synaphobranchus kaupii]|uniref:Membrane-spanning 4-domains subfamily A member 4A-like n=1 Tax=Synaphobranchus kaupii TaxID=118154 RepID=A0A9Q1IFU9_SYNKA|nr:hypothetical protein SKAU_G00371280 [Synaphobranchus kaupii]